MGQRTEVINLNGGTTKSKRSCSEGIRLRNELYYRILEDLHNEPLLPNGVVHTSEYMASPKLRLVASEALMSREVLDNSSGHEVPTFE